MPHPHRGAGRTDRQVEQDLVISRALVELFSQPAVASALAFRGGTALYKLHFRPAARYSEDIDLVQTSAMPIGPVLDAIHGALDHWLGKPQWKQTDGRVTHFVAALGTCGTFVGAGRRLRAENPHMRLVAVQPDGPYHALEGVKHLPTTGLIPGIYDSTLQDQVIEVGSEAAFEMVRALARAEGLMVGISAAANVAAALRVARELEQGVVVTILCDGAAKYLSDRFWDEEGI